MKTELTQAEQDLMHQVRDEWIQHALTRNGQIDEEAFEEGIEWLYTELLGLEKPKIVYCDSLLSASLVIYTLRSLKEVDLQGVGDSAITLIHHPVRDSVSTSVMASVWNSVWGSVDTSVKSQIYEAIKGAVKDVDLEGVWDSVWFSVKDSFIDSIRNSVWDSVRYSVDSSVRDSVWNSVWVSVGNQIHEAIKAAVKNIDLEDVKFSVDYSVTTSVINSVWNLIWNSVMGSVIATAGRQIHESIKAAVKDIDLEEVGDSVGDLVNSSVFHSVVDSVSNSVSNSVWDSVRASVDESVWNSVIIPIHEAIKNITASKLEDILGKNSTYINYGDYGWVAFYDFFTRIGVVDHERFNKYLKLIKSGVFETFEYKNIVFAVRSPVEFRLNNQGRLHSYDGPAVTNLDGTVYYFIHGVSIKTDLWKKLETDTLTFEDLIKQDNEEVKAAILSYIEENKGSEGVYRFISEHLKEVDTYVDKKPEQYLEGTTGGMDIGVYTLYKGTVGGLRMAYVRCFCPSSDRLFFLSVHPDNNNAKDAIASLYRVPKKLANHIKYIQRQGERFSTVFDEAGRKKLSKMTKEELSDLVPISGNEYFEKMRYEY